ncbi:hypothetical protein BCON_0291g00040 [Botryotinia convoluta]|uniref:Uncharacterized protein n=1 Tax=Botryotinia convoluta TaxID=54673 RepID=A0A4Z1HQA1_9HELO|nr:hypothetical protein BCON_0291g00040 [Botryotinia convoluta]
MQPPARFRPQRYNSPDLVRRPDTAEPTSRALYFVSPCNVQRRSTKLADPALRYYYPYCFSQLPKPSSSDVTKARPKFSCQPQMPVMAMMVPTRT